MVNGGRWCCFVSRDFRVGAKAIVGSCILELLLDIFGIPKAVLFSLIWPLEHLCGAPFFQDWEVAKIAKTCKTHNQKAHQNPSNISNVLVKNWGRVDAGIVQDGPQHQGKNGKLSPEQMNFFFMVPPLALGGPPLALGKTNCLRMVVCCCARLAQEIERLGVLMILQNRNKVHTV